MMRQSKAQRAAVIRCRQRTVISSKSPARRSNSLTRPFGSQIIQPSRKTSVSSCRSRLLPSHRIPGEFPEAARSGRPSGLHRVPLCGRFVCCEAGCPSRAQCLSPCSPDNNLTVSPFGCRRPASITERSSRQQCSGPAKSPGGFRENNRKRLSYLCRSMLDRRYGTANQTDLLGLRTSRLRSASAVARDCFPASGSRFLF